MIYRVYLSWRCFQVTIQESNNKCNISLNITLGLRANDKELWKNLITYLNCGRYIPEYKRNEVYFIVTKFSDIYDKLIPLLDKHPLIGYKLDNYLDFVKVANLIKTKNHLTNEGKAEIKLIKNGMNSKRK